MERKTQLLKQKESNDVLLGGDFKAFEDRKVKRNLSPLKYKYDVVGSFNVFGLRKNYRKFIDADIGVQEDLNSKRSLVMNPKRRRLLEEFNAKRKFLVK